MRAAFCMPEKSPSIDDKVRIRITGIAVKIKTQLRASHVNRDGLSAFGEETIEVMCDVFIFLDYRKLTRKSEFQSGLWFVMVKLLLTSEHSGR